MSAEERLQEIMQAGLTPTAGAVTLAIILVSESIDRLTEQIKPTTDKKQLESKLESVSRAMNRGRYCANCMEKIGENEA